MSTALRLHTYFRSSAAYRVRIALNLKGVEYESVTWQMARGEHLRDEYRAQAGFGLVPMLEIDGLRLQQSQAIIEYLEARFPDPSLLPEGEADKARARALSQLIACEIHPLNNLRVLKRLRSQFSATEAQVGEWYRHWCDEGLRAVETELARTPDTLYALGDVPSIVDCFLVPQVFNAVRFEVDLGPFPRIADVVEACKRHDAFDRAQPSRQPDAT